MPSLPLHAIRRVDACPECVTNTEKPCAVSTTDGGFTAAYRCSACGHEWNTSWKD